MERALSDMDRSSLHRSEPDGAPTTRSGSSSSVVGNLASMSPQNGCASSPKHHGGGSGSQATASNKKGPSPACSIPSGSPSKDAEFSLDSLCHSTMVVEEAGEMTGNGVCGGGGNQNNQGGSNGLQSSTLTAIQELAISKIRPGEFVMRVLFAEFTAYAEKKIEAVMLEPVVSIIIKYLKWVK